MTKRKKAVADSVGSNADLKLLDANDKDRKTLHAVYHDKFLQDADIKNAEHRLIFAAHLTETMQKDVGITVDLRCEYDLEQSLQGEKVFVRYESRAYVFDNKNINYALSGFPPPTAQREYDLRLNKEVFARY
jgi:hypothetical protein